MNQMNITIESTNTMLMKNLNYVALEVEPPREISEEEKHLRDRKEKQMKMKELVS